MEENLKTEETMPTANDTPVNHSDLRDMEFLPMEGLSPLQLEEFSIKDEGEIVFKGNDEQIAQMLTDYSKYYGEVANPWNTMTNTFLKNKYAPLNEVLNTVRPVLAENGFSVIQTPKVDDKGDVLVQTVLMHKAGAMICFPSLKSRAVKADIQGLGAAITYLRRFSISTILGVASENDDDGETNSTDKKAPAKKATTTLTDKQKTLRKDLITLCSDLIAKDASNKSKIIESLKKIEPNGNVNKLKTEKEFNQATEIVKGLGL